MTPTDMYEFIKNHLELTMKDNSGYDYGRKYREIHVSLTLTHPVTLKTEPIASFDLSLED
jgi:hypothetical protein